MKKLIPLLFLAFVGCRSDRPPVLSVICTMDGFGGGDCVKADGERVHLLPSEMENYWATTQVDQANFSAWCYGVTTKTANAALNHIKKHSIKARE